jgi:hypothetical protein
LHDTAWFSPPIPYRKWRFFNLGIFCCWKTDRQLSAVGGKGVNVIEKTVLKIRLVTNISKALLYKKKYFTLTSVSEKILKKIEKKNKEVLPDHCCCTPW